MGTLAFEDGRHTETPPSLSFLNDGNLSIISMSVTLGARASVMKCVEELYEEKSTEISNTTNVQDDIAKTVHEVVEDTMGKLRLSFEDELNRLKELMERECLGAFSGHRLATDHHNLSMIFGNKRKMFGEPDGGSSLGLGVSATDADNNLLRPPPQKRPCGHRRNSSVSSVETMLNLGSGGSSRQIDHSRTVHLTVRSAPEFVCPYSKHNSLTKDHSHRTSCRGTFDGASKLRQHVRIAYRAYFCPVENCFARFPSTDERKGHIEPCKEKGPKASREISVEDREAFKNAKIMMEKNVPLTQIQEIIDQLCKDDNCDCRKSDKRKASESSDSGSYHMSSERSAQRSPSPDRHLGIQIGETGPYTANNEAGALFQFDGTAEMHNQPEGMVVDSTNQQYTTATTMGWEDPTQALWAQHDLKSGLLSEAMTPSIRIQNEDASMDYNNPLGYPEWPEGNRQDVLGSGPEEGYSAYPLGRS